MSALGDLEALLQRERDPKTWAVYADALQAKGDPRGELIALDLELERQGRAPTLVRRRNDALFAWLGGTSIAGRRWNPWRFRCGLLDDAGARSPSSCARRPARASRCGGTCGGERSFPR